MHSLLRIAIVGIPLKVLWIFGKATRIQKLTMQCEPIPSPN